MFRHETLGVFESALGLVAIVTPVGSETTTVLCPLRLNFCRIIFCNQTSGNLPEHLKALTPPPYEAFKFFRPGDVVIGKQIEKIRGSRVRQNKLLSQ